MKKTCFPIIFILSLFIPFIVAAQIDFPNPLEADTIPEVIDAIGELIFYVGIALVTLMILIGGIMFITATGNPQRTETARRLLFWTVVGGAIVVFARAITGIIAYILGG